MRHLSPARIVTMLVVLLGATAARAEHTTRLSIDSPFVELGDAATLRLDGHPNSTFLMLLSPEPVELPAGELGTLFVAPGTFTLLALGLLSDDGSATRNVNLPPLPALDGVVLYVQAVVISADGTRLTNSVSVRGQSQPVTSARVSRALALSPDGALAFVAHQADGSISVIDTATDTVVAEQIMGPAAAGIPYGPVHVGVDPLGRHAFAVNAAARHLGVMHLPSLSVSGNVPLPVGSRRIAFDYDVSPPRIYVTNESDNSVQIITEPSPGQFELQSPIALQGVGPGPIVVLPDGKLVVAHRVSLELELVDPVQGAGATTLTKVNLGVQPLALAASANRLFVTTQLPEGPLGINRLEERDASTLSLTRSVFENLGADYGHIGIGGGKVAVSATGSGALLVAELDALESVQRIDVAGAGSSGAPGTPEAAVLLPNQGNGDVRAYVVDRFRETVRPVALPGSGAPSLLAEIPLSHSGAPRIPLTNDLNAVENGEYLLRSVAFFNGTSDNPNPVTCQSCHTDLVSDNNASRIRQPQTLLGLGDTAPYNWRGTGPTLGGIVFSTFFVHGAIGGPQSLSNRSRMLQALQSLPAPRSIYLLEDGSLEPQAEMGRALFEGAAGCTDCHAGPAFIPPAPQPLTIDAGVGTGLTPANVPSLRAAWVNAPYFHDASALTLHEVFSAKPGDVHNTLTQSLSSEEIDALVAYLRTL